MREEFHGNGGEGGTWIYKLYYGWGTLNTNVWLPSLCELVGYDSNNYLGYAGTYYSAMQGLNASTKPYVDAKGGAQFTYFQQFNTSGGGERIWNACGMENTWLRSPDIGQAKHVTRIADTSTINTYILPTESHAVHPAGTDR